MAYEFSRPAAQVGQIQRMPNTIIESFKAGMDIPFGRPLMRDLTKNGVVVRYNNDSPITFFNAFLGVSVFDDLTPPTATRTGGQYYTDDMVSVITAGRFWTTLDSGLTINVDDYCYLNQDSLSGFDDFTNINDGSGDQLIIGKFLTSGDSDGRDGKVVFLIEIIIDRQHV